MGEFVALMREELDYRREARYAERRDRGFFKPTTSDPDADPLRFRRELAELSQEWYEGEGSETVFKRNFAPSCATC